jgi:hypothetical protein
MCVRVFARFSRGVTTACVRAAAPLRAVKLPTSHGVPINLAKMYREVCSRGGYNNVRAAPRRSRFRTRPQP